MNTRTAPLPPLQSLKDLDQLRERSRYLRDSIRTEQGYVHWVRAYIRFHGRRHPAGLGCAEIEALLSSLANERGVAAATYRQAVAALLFFYRKVLGIDLPWMDEIGRPRATRRLPVVLTHCRQRDGRLARVRVLAAQRPQTSPRCSVRFWQPSAVGDRFRAPIESTTSGVLSGGGETPKLSVVGVWSTAPKGRSGR